jgi:hypothetical protein
VVNQLPRISGIWKHANAVSSCAIGSKGFNERSSDESVDGLLSLEDIAHLSLSTTELVSLSACSTHLSDGYPGEGLVGMQRAFHGAGARCVVLSLWPVRNVTADTFFKAFYSRLVSGSPSEVAFGETVREFLVQRKDRVLKDVVLDVGCYLISLNALADE